MTALLAHVQISTALAFILGYFSAHAAGLLTKEHAPPWVLGVTTHALATAAAVIPTVAFHPGDRWTVYLGNVVAALFMANQAHRTGAPAALKARTGGVVGGKGRRVAHDAGFTVVGLLLALLIVAVVLPLAFAAGHVWLWLLLLLLLVIWL